MAAGENLGPQFKGKFLYHEAPIRDRESIRDSGLRPHKPFTPASGPDVYPHGVYLSEPQGSEYGSSMHDASHYGFDRWRVNVEGVQGLSKDPDPYHTTSHFTPNAIEPSRMKLAKKGNPDWEKNI